MVGHLCKHGLLRKCSSSRCGFCRKLKKKPDDVRMPSADIDKFNENVSMLHREVLKDCRSLIKKQTKLIDELYAKIKNMDYQQNVLLEVTKRSALAITAIKDGDDAKADHLLDTIKPMLEEAFVMEQEDENGKKEEDPQGGSEGDAEGDEEGFGKD